MDYTKYETKLLFLYLCRDAGTLFKYGTYGIPSS
jgi:hypothetical protein